MKFTINIFLIFLLTFGSFINVLPQSNVSTPKFRPSEKAYKWADKELKKMSVDEKVGQMVHIGINARFLNQDSNEYKELRRQIVENKLGGIVLFGAPIYESVILVNRMQEAAKTPLLIAVDAETGVGMRFSDAENFPWNMAVAATGNPDFARQIGVITGREARALGIMQVYAPVLDVNNNPNNPVINVRSYGENPAEVGRFGAAFIEGLQSQNVLATAKHFPGHGDTAIDSHRGLPIINVSRQTLDKIEFPPFEQAIKAGVAAIMVAHIALPQIDPTEIKPLKNFIQGDAEEGAEIVKENATMPATLSPVVQTEILRKQMNFQGLIVTDAMSMSGLTIYFNQDEAAVRAVLAGADILEKPADVDLTIKGLKTAVASGRIPTERLDQSVRKILAWKYELGLEKQKITPLEQIDKTVSGEDSRQLSNEIAENAITLVKKEEGVLPLAKDKKIFMLGITNGDDRNFAANTFQRTLRQSGYKFESAVLDERSTAEEITAARKKADEADIILAGLFGRVRSGAKNSVGIPENAANLLRELLQSDKKVVNISFGNPYLLNNFPEMKTYIVAYGDMTSLQRATARAIVGEIDFKGKLPISLGEKFPRGVGLNLQN
ncbi:MAG: glycoside hydrolase family 3 N-terminal domain-containing protein [Acidobacteriota bacterium]